MSFCCICNAGSRSPRALSATSQCCKPSTECLARDQASSLSSLGFLKSAGGALGLHLVLICGGNSFPSRRLREEAGSKASTAKNPTNKKRVILAAGRREKRGNVCDLLLIFPHSRVRHVILSYHLGHCWI